MIRIYAYLFILLFAISTPINAINQIKVFVPGDEIHAEQELRAGHKSDIYIKISHDIPLSSLYIKLESNIIVGIDELWDNVYSNAHDFLLSNTYLPTRDFDHSGQSYKWPDTFAISLSASNPENYTTPGTFLISKFLVNPRRLGTMQFSAVEIIAIDANNNLVPFDFVASTIEVVEDYDCNANGTGDYRDIILGTSNDCNENLIPDECESFFDCNNNGIDDQCEDLQDCNDNGIPDICEDFADCNNNGIPDECDFDCNFNGIPDECETMIDCNCNGIPDDEDISTGNTPDLNFNNIPDICENIPDYYYRIVVPANQYHGPQEMLVGFEEDIYVLAYTDGPIKTAVAYAEFEWSSGYELWNYIEGVQLSTTKNFDINGVNYFETSRNSPDTLEGYALQLIAGGEMHGDFAYIKLTVIPTDSGIVTVSNSRSSHTSDSSLFQDDNSQLLYVPMIADDITITYYPDCNGNLILDSIDIVNGLLTDCNNNFIADFCESRDYPDRDCNNNRIIDLCEITNNPSLDCNNNGVLDICDIANDTILDCDGNDMIDACEIAENSSLDCNVNSILDACEINNDPSLDCNNNNVLDGCDILYGTSNDCNLNQLPDECDFDCNFNGIPDECETFADCNCNALPDSDDIASGWSNDFDLNGKPDECEGKAGTYIRIYAIGTDGLPVDELPVNIESEIIFSFTTDQMVDGFTIPISPLSEDNSRMWDYLDINDVEYLHQADLGYLGLSLLYKQSNQWPDTLLMTTTKLVGQVPFESNKTLPLIRLHVTPTQTGLLDWETSQFPPNNNFTYLSAADQINYPMTLIANDFGIGCCRLTRGNIDYDIANTTDISDVIYLVEYQFGNPNGPPPFCFDEADVDNNNSLDIGDLVFLIAYQFRGGSPPHSCQE